MVLAFPTAAAGRRGIELVGQRRLDDRLSELTFRSPLLVERTHARVLLPRGYSRSTRRYPVLYLLHGAVDDYRSWTTKGDAEALTAGLPLIVVMPDTGPIGGYVDWLRGGNRWETFHLTKLVPWIDRRYRTEGRRAGRAVAGLSMGGFGSMSYAARQPDSFAAAASFSGAVDSVNPAIQAVTPEDTYGPFATQEIRWRGKNPVDLAANLRGLRLVLRTGNGAPGGPFGGADGIEQVVHQAGVTLHDRLRTLGIPHVWDDYGAWRTQLAVLAARPAGDAPRADADVRPSAESTRAVHLPEHRADLRDLRLASADQAAGARVEPSCAGRAGAGSCSWAAATRA